jgi:hypothetical protein
LRRQKSSIKLFFFAFFEPEKLKYIKMSKTKIVENMKTHILSSKFQKKIVEKKLF